MRTTDGAADPSWELTFAWFRIHRDTMRRLLAPLDLTPMQMHALRALEPGRPQRMAHLATGLHCDPANITSVVAPLTERGLVIRVPDEGDRRVRAVELTSSGALIRARLDWALTSPPEAIARLSETDRQALTRILGLLTEQR